MAEGDAILRADAVRPRGTWNETPADCVVLGFDDRHRRRLRLAGIRGLTFLLDLSDATTLRGGDALQLEDGRLVEIVAAPESLVEVVAEDAATVLRIAWHLGNRHQQVQFMGLKLRLRRDHVIEAMIGRLGGAIREIEAPFDPESGAYSGPDQHEHAYDRPHHHHD